MFLLERSSIPRGLLRQHMHCYVYSSQIEFYPLKHNTFIDDLCGMMDKGWQRAEINKTRASEHRSGETAAPSYLSGEDTGGVFLLRSTD